MNLAEKNPKNWGNQSKGRDIEEEKRGSDWGTKVMTESDGRMFGSAETVKRPNWGKKLNTIR